MNLDISDQLIVYYVLNREELVNAMDGNAQEN